VAEQLPSEEQIREELRRLKVQDVVVQTVMSLSSLGYAKLDRETRDLDQARLAIDALGALVPVLEGSVAAELLRDLNQVKANLQLAYASAVAKGPEETTPPDEARAAQEGAAGEDRPADG
jgi:hypothetical protein